MMILHLTVYNDNDEANQLFANVTCAQLPYNNFINGFKVANYSVLVAATIIVCGGGILIPQ